MADTSGADRRHRAFIAAARVQYERAAAQGIPTGGSSNIDGLGNALSARPARRPPDLPGYRILSELHSGGQGVVYQAIQQSTGRIVAVKVLRGGMHAGGSEWLRFRREVNILAQLNHRSIVGILDSGEDGGNHFLAMDFVDGLPLDRHARDRGLSLADRLSLFVEVCEAVSAAHLRGVIHRDLKPGNILVDEAGHPRVLDFGLAKMSEGQADAGRASTQVGQFVGSLPWASPEQVRGLHDEVDIRSDVYSLGVILYQLLTDRLPFSTIGDIEHVLATIRTAEPIRPRALSREIDEDLETIVLKCLAKEPQRRYQSVGELARDICHYQRGEPIEARRESAGYVLRKMLHRHRSAVAAACAFVALLTGAAVLSLGLWRQTIVQRDEAIVARERESAARTRTDAEAAKATQIAQFAQSILSGIDPATAGDMDKRLMRLILDGAVRRVETELVGQPEVEAAMRHAIGKAYEAIGEMPPARIQLERAVELLRQTHGDDHADTCAAMDDLAAFYEETAQFADAERLCRAVLETRRRLLGEEDRLTLLSRSNLAEIWGSQGRNQEAEAEDRQLLEQRTRLFGPEDPHTLTSMNNLASTLQRLQQFAESEQLYLRAIEIENRVKGPLHPHTLRTTANLALLYQENLKMEEALPLHRKVLESRQRVFGDEHPDTCESLVNLAIVLRAMGQVDEAEALLRRALEAERRVLGDRHPVVGGTLAILASITTRRGELAEGERLIRECVAIYESSLGPDHFKTITARISVGVCLSLQSKFEEAERILLDGHAALGGRPDATADWRVSGVKYLIQLYEAWDAAAPNSGKAEQAAHWREVLTSL